MGGLVVDLGEELPCLHVSKQVTRLVDIEIEEPPEGLVGDVAVLVHAGPLGHLKGGHRFQEMPVPRCRRMGEDVLRWTLV